MNQFNIQYTIVRFTIKPLFCLGITFLIVLPCFLCVSTKYVSILVVSFEDIIKFALFNLKLYCKEIVHGAFFNLFNASKFFFKKKNNWDWD